MRLAAFLILAIALLLIGIIVAVENQPQKLPLIQAAAPNPVTVVPWRLFATCPVDRRNIPTLPKETV